MTFKRPAWLVMTVSLLVVSVQGVQAQSITGKVKSMDNTPVDSLTVVIEKKGGKPFGTTLTDARGRFKLQQVPAAKSPYTFKIYSGKKELYKKAIVVDRDVKFRGPIRVNSTSPYP